MLERTGHSDDEFLQGFGFPAANSDTFVGKENLYSQSGMPEDLQVLKLPHSSWHKFNSIKRFSYFLAGNKILKSTCDSMRASNLHTTWNIKRDLILGFIVKKIEWS